MTTPTITIFQGPGAAPYNCIVQPYPGGSVARGATVECIHPQTRKSVTGVCVDHWTFLWAQLPDEFCLGAYGVDALAIYKYLQQKPEFSSCNYVRFCKLDIIDKQDISILQ